MCGASNNSTSMLVLLTRPNNGPGLFTRLYTVEPVIG